MEWMTDLSEIGHLIYLTMNYVIDSVLRAGISTIFLYWCYKTVTGNNPLGGSTDKDSK
jgi:hypothetical protein